VRVSDRFLLYAAGTLRAIAAATTGVSVGAYLKALGYGAATVGYVTSAGLSGAAIAMLLATIGADTVGRRRTLVLLSALGAVGGAVVLWPLPELLLIAVGFVAMWNGMGRDRGPASMLEQAMLPATATEQTRTTAFARYNALQDAGNALGFLIVAGMLAVPIWIASPAPTNIRELRIVLAIYPITSLAAIVLYTCLSPSVEAPTAIRRAPLSREGRRVITRLSALFALDSLGGGFVSAALVSYFFFERFGAPIETVALLFFAARILNALSHLAAARLARWIGLVNTMVFTHIPSSLFLASAAIVPSFSVAAALFLLRESLAEMDVPTRQSYVMTVVRPEERTIASGITNLVRLTGWAIAPAIGGALMEGYSLAVPLVAGAALKIAYDIALWLSFHRLAPPEERPAGHAV
jgi:MFS family permease